MKQLDRVGRFKVRPLEWWLQEAASGAVGIGFRLQVLADWFEDAWRDWSAFEEHEVKGMWWVVKRDKGINQSAVDQLVAALGWSGSLEHVYGDAPTRIVQVTVQSEEYKDEIQYRAQWMDPEDADPTGGTGAMSAERGQELQTQFGALLRAAASGGKPPAKTPDKPITEPDDALPF